MKFPSLKIRGMNFPFFTRGKGLSRNPSDNPQKNLYSTLSSWANRRVNLGNYSSTLKFRETTRNIVVYRCMNKIAGSVQAVPWYVERDPDASPQEQDAITDQLLSDYQAVFNNPSHFSGAQLRYWIAAVYALLGQVSLKVGVYGGKPNAIYPLRSDKIAEIIDRFGNVVEYSYGDTEKCEKIPVRSKVEDETGHPVRAFGVRLVKPDIFLDPSAATSPLDALAIPTDIVNNLLARAHDLVDGTPNVKNILWTSGKGVAEALKDRFADKNVWDSGTWVFLEDIDSLNYVPVSDGLENIHTKVPLDDMARHIAGVFEIPVALIGLAGQDGSKFANNYEQSRLSFWEDTIDPQYLRPIEEALSNNICPVGMRLKFDRDEIPALRSERINSILNIDKINFLTDNEKRELSGFQQKI